MKLESQDKIISGERDIRNDKKRALEMDLRAILTQTLLIVPLIRANLYHIADTNGNNQERPLRIADINGSQFFL